MTGLDLARGYWMSCGAPMMERDFPELLPKVAVGLCGAGSECFGYDDEVSRDHDFEPGFCLFLPGEDVVSRREEFLLERAYARLPGEFKGFARSRLSPVGGNRHGPIRASRFWEEHTGTPDGRPTPAEWLLLPDYALAEATNGAIFRDDSGFFTRVREGLVPPEDVVNKKLAGALFIMGQAGQYNVPRCLAHGERAASRLAAAKFVQAALHAEHLVNGCFLPYYKWAFRSLLRLPFGREAAMMLECALNGDLSAIESVCAGVAHALRERDPALPDTCEMETLAYRVNDRIRDESIRNLHILYTVRD